MPIAASFFQQAELADVHNFNFDHPDAFDTPLLLDCVAKLKAGQPVEVPTYDFSKHARGSETKRVSVMEGNATRHGTAGKEGGRHRWHLEDEQAGGCMRAACTRHTEGQYVVSPTGQQHVACMQGSEGLAGMTQPALCSTPLSCFCTHRQYLKHLNAS